MWGCLETASGLGSIEVKANIAHRTYDATKHAILMPKSHYGVTSGCEEISLSAIRPCRMGISSSGALDMNESVDLTIDTC